MLTGHVRRRPHWHDKDNDKMNIRPEDKREIVIQRLDEFGREMTTKEVLFTPKLTSLYRGSSGST
jgi:hypothetical protein